jgi:RNA polymerase sigma-70 factor, ECF subfamily
MGNGRLVSDRELQWAELMRAADRGDVKSYHRLLTELAPVLRGVARRGFARYGVAPEDVEDVVQETLLALHLKRQTWNEAQPLVPWVLAIARNKLVDNLRRRGKGIHLPIDDVSEILADDQPSARMNDIDAISILGKLKGREREIVLAISVEGASAREVSQRLGMTEGAVRVALHRALKSLAKAFRTGPP